MILLTLINISFGYNNNDFKKTYTWHEIQPQIVLCHDAKVNVKSVKKAMKFWKELGFKMKDDLKIKYCNESNYHKNEIRIAGQRNLDTTSYYAITDRAHQDIYMNSAIIKIEKNKNLSPWKFTNCTLFQPPFT